MSEEETRDQIEEIINNEEPVNEAVIETIIEEETIPKPTPKAKSRAKPKIRITKEPVEPVESIIEEPIVDNKSRAKPKIKITKEPVVEEIEPVVQEPEQPKKIYKLKQIAKCPDCNMDMTVHTLKYIHKRHGFCKADIKAEPEKPVPEPEQPKPKIT